MQNQTSVTEFMLLGVTDIQFLEPLLFMVFLVIYFVNVTGNGAILLIVTSDPKLHSPMYFFLGNVSCLNISYSTVVLPKMLENFLSTHKIISFFECTTQLHFFHFLGSTEAMLLAVMALDCFVNISKPLHYTVIMNSQCCTQLAVTIWTLSFFHALLHAIMTSHLNFCGSNHIHHFSIMTLSHCWIWPVGTLRSPCGCPILSQGQFSWAHFLLTLLSYFYIITYLIYNTHSCSTLQKALSTCASHFMVVILFYVPILFIYTHPTSGSSIDQNQIIVIIYTMVTPVVNPLVYTLRNKEVKRALYRLINKRLT